MVVVGTHFFIFAYGGLVVEIQIHWTAKVYFVAPLPTSTSFKGLIAQNGKMLPQIGVGGLGLGGGGARNIPSV